MTNTQAAVKTTELEQAVLAAIAELNTQDVAQLAAKLERKEMSIRAVLMSLTKKGLLAKAEQEQEEKEEQQQAQQNPKKEPRVTKSSVVRERILQAKQHNEQPDVVVAFAVEQLGMARPLARVYVKENWPKVEYAGEQQEQQPETAE